MKSYPITAWLWAAAFPLFASVHPPVPAEVTSFTGQCSDKLLRLSWTTRKETNTLYFRIEKSADAIHWQGIGAVKGAHHSTRRISYRFVAPAQEGPYFRLVVVDRDSSEYELPHIEVLCLHALAGTMRLEVDPPQTSNLFEVRAWGLSDLAPARLEILDHKGRLHAVAPLFSNQGRWARSYHVQDLQLPPGRYFLRLRQEGKVRKVPLVVLPSPQ